MKKRLTPVTHENAKPLKRLHELQMRWNRLVGDLAAARQSMPEAMEAMLNGFGAECGGLLAEIAFQMEKLLSQPEMKKVLASLVECKKMEIRRGSIEVSEFVEENTSRRLHTHLFFQAQDGVAFGEGLDQYKDVMEELVRRLRLLTKMGTLPDPILERCIKDLKECSEMFQKKRESILEKASIPLDLLSAFSVLIDDALLLPKITSRHHQVSLASFHPERSVKMITVNMAEFFDDLHSPNTEPMLQQFRRTKIALAKKESAVPAHVISSAKPKDEHRVSA